jgi:AraC-like DNA-binding protein
VRFFFSTEHVHESEQFAYWRVVMTQIGICLTPERDESGPFRAWLRWREFGGTTVAEASAPHHRLRRSGGVQPIVAPEYAVLVNLGAGARYVLGRDEWTIRKGEGLLVNAAAWTAAEYADGTRCGAIRIPSRLLGAGLDAGGPLAIPFARDAALGALIADYARNIVGGAFGACRPATSGETEIIGHLCGLLRLAIRDSATAIAPAPIRPGAARLAAIEAYLDANFADPGLSPSSAAAQFGISVRYLDKLFRRTGRSFMEALLQRRLSACCAMLAEHERKRPIAEIARRAGFGSLTQFNRRFRAAYGITPRAWRARQH